MRRLLLLLLALLGWGVPALAQSTTVSGTIADSGGQAWFSGTIQLLFRPSDSNPSAQYFWNGAPFDKSTTIPQNPLSLDNTGSFSGVSVPSNTSIAPAGSTWTVTVCPAATVPNCFTKNLTITGTTQDISSQVIPPPVVVNFSVPLLGARAYTDAEVVGASPGAIYFNVTDNTLHVCQQQGFPPCTWVSQTTLPIPVFNGVSYIGGGNSAFWGGGEICAQANAAYAALPAAGGDIAVLPGFYQCTTSSIVFATPGKYPHMYGIGVGNTTAGTFNGIPAGTVIQFTPATGAAITLDYVPVGAAAWNGRHGIDNLTIISNQLTIYGGTIATPNTSTSMGVAIGNTNSGALGASFYNLDLRGFNTLFNVTNQLSWGMVFYNPTGMFSQHGFHIQDIEQVTIHHPHFVYNLHALETSSQIGIFGGSIDQNGGETSGARQTSATTPAIVDIAGSAFGAVLDIHATNMEQGQSGAQNPMQLVGFTNASNRGMLKVYGGTALDDDTNTGHASQNWYSAPFTLVDGVNAFSGGRHGVINTGSVTTTTRAFNQTPTLLTSSAGLGLADYGMNGDGTIPTATFGSAVNATTGFQIGGGALLGVYATNTWTPVATSLGHTGASPTITGQYTQIGKMVMWEIQIAPGTSTSSVAGTTSFTLPPPGNPIGGSGFSFTAGDLITFNGVGVVNGTAISPPSWTTITTPVYLTGTYMVP